MKRSFLKMWAQQFYQKTFSRRALAYREEDLGRSAMVFSPHFDDETLGCGGTILRKTAAAAAVKIIFMTDGSKSHTHLISEAESSSIRRQEGLAAGRALGLKANDVILLDFEEAKLDRHQEAARERVEEILECQRPEEVFIPYHKEPLLWSADHRATYQIVRTALAGLDQETRVYEYPIWFWCHWPWAQLPLRRRRDIVRHLANHSFLHGVDLLRDFNRVVDVSAFLKQKRTALEEHKSQMTRLIPGVQWRTLSDVAGGEFLMCFFQDYEVFCAYRLCGRRMMGFDGDRSPVHRLPRLDEDTVVRVQC